MVTENLVGKKINCTMMSGERRQGKLVSIDRDSDTFVINWKKDQADDFFFRTELRINRIESLTEIIHPPKGQAPSEN